MRFRVYERGDVIDWHPWFAWIPVKCAPHDVRWLEVVERRAVLKDGWVGHNEPPLPFWDYEYRQREEE